MISKYFIQNLNVVTEQIAASTDICLESQNFEKLQEIISRVDTNDTLEEKWIEDAEIYSWVMSKKLWHKTGIIKVT